MFKSKFNVTVNNENRWKTTMPRTKIKAELVDASEIPSRKSQYDWKEYFGQLLKNPTKVMKFTGVARSTVNEAVIRYNDNDENLVKFAIRGKREKVNGKTKESIYVSVIPAEPETTPSEA
jgi:hypothetical protein